MPEPIPGKLYVWKWGERGLYQTKDLIHGTRVGYHSLKKGDVFLLLEYGQNQKGDFLDVVLKVLVGEACGWILYGRLYSIMPLSWDSMEEYIKEYTESSS